MWAAFRIPFQNNTLIVITNYNLTIRLCVPSYARVQGVSTWITQRIASNVGSDSQQQVFKRTYQQRLDVAYDVFDAVICTVAS
jgi:hypothetical protein